MEKEYITAADAAEILGVTRQTVINYVKKGWLKGRKMGNTFFINKEYFDSVMPQAEDLCALNAGLDKVNKDIAEAISKRNGELKNYEDDGSWLHFLRSSKVSRQLLTTLFHSLGERCLTAREEKIVCRVAEGCPTKDIAAECGMTTQRARMVFIKAMDKIGGLASYSSVLDENDRLRKEIETIKDSYEKVIEENERLLVMAGKKKQEQSAFSITEDEIGMAEVLAEPIDNLSFPTRLRKCLVFEGIETIGDIITKNKTDLRKIRNMGKKSLSELDDFISSLNLSFGTPQEKVDNLKKKYTLYLAMQDNHHGTEQEERRARD